MAKKKKKISYFSPLNLIFEGCSNPFRMKQEGSRIAEICLDFFLRQPEIIHLMTQGIQSAPGQSLFSDDELFSSVAQSCLTLCDAMSRSTPGLPVHHQLLKFTQTQVHRVGDAIQPSHPLSSPSPPAFNLSSIMVFSNESILHMRWSMYWSFSFSSSNEYSGLISFRKSPCSPRDSQESSPIPQFKSIILQSSAFFIVQLSYPYMTTGKTIALTRQTLFGKAVSLLFNMLSSWVIAFLPWRSIF